MSDKPRIVATIITHNSGRHLPILLAEMPRDIIDDILVIDCASSDDTILAAKQGGADIITESSGMHGAAFKKGLAKLGEYNPDIVVSLDGYYRYFPSEISRLVEPIIEAKYDIALGARVLEDPAVKPFSKPAEFYNNRIAAEFKTERYRLFDITPFRAARYDALLQLNAASDDMGWLIEMPLRAFRQGFRVCEVPVHYNPNIPCLPSKEFDEDSFYGRRLLWNVFCKYRHLLR